MLDPRIVAFMVFIILILVILLFFGVDAERLAQ